MLGYRWTRNTGWLAIAIATIIFASSLGPLMIAVAPQSNGISFTFAASGDLGATAATTNSLSQLRNLNTNFFLALGDLSYSDTGPEPTDGNTPSPWCDYVHGQLGNNYPFEIVTGNHEKDGGPDGYIWNFAACLPDMLSAQGQYPLNYYFDYPSSAPIARVFMLTPNIGVGGYWANFSPGTQQANWLSSNIDNARSNGITWIIVGMHYPCLNIGVFSCNMGNDLMQLLIQKKVDLVLTAHEHNYQRSKELTCASDGIFQPQCVANDGSTGVYTKGAGTIFVTQGAIGGGGFMMVDFNEPNGGYFAKAMGGSQIVEGHDGQAVPTPGGGRGFMQYTVTQSAIQAKFVMTTQLTPGAVFRDSWSIGAGGPVAGISVTPSTGIGAKQQITLKATPSGGIAPYLYSWNFGDNTPESSGQSTTHAYSVQGNYIVTLTVVDSTGQTGTATKTIAVGKALIPPLAGNFTVSQANAGSVLSFNAFLTGGQPPYTVNWDFGDGSTGIGVSTQHAYTRPGNYTVTLRVNDSTGSKISSRGLLRVVGQGQGPSTKQGTNTFALIPAVVAAAVIASSVAFFSRSSRGRKILGVKVKWYSKESDESSTHSDLGTS